MITSYSLPTYLAGMWSSSSSIVAVAWHEHGVTVIFVGAIVGACTVVWTQALGPLTKRFVARWKRILKYFDRMELTMDAVETTLLTNNGGSTLKDKADKTYDLAKKAVALAGEAKDRAAETADKVDALLAKWEETH